MQILVAQIGARRHYAVPRALHEAGILDRLVTDACVDVWPWRLVGLLPRSIMHGTLASIAGRRTGLPRGKVHGLPWLALSGLLRLRRQPGESNVSYWTRKNLRFGESVVRTGFGNADAVYVFNGAGLEILRKAREESTFNTQLRTKNGKQRTKNLEPFGGAQGKPRTDDQQLATQQPGNSATVRRMGLFCIVDQTSAAMRWDAKLLMEEAERWPDWLTPQDSMDGWETMAAREEEEWRLADRIICGSQYVVDTIKAVGGPVEKCRVVPYGYEVQGEKCKVTSDRSDSNPVQLTTNTQATNNQQPRTKNEEPGTAQRKLRVLFVGTLCLRKGIPYLYEAMKRLDPKEFEFRFVGPSAISQPALAMLKTGADVRGSVSRSSMREHYNWADVLVLPTLSEGSANVVYEAFLAKLPVIATANAGVAVHDGHDGFVVPMRDSEALAASLMMIRNTTGLLVSLSAGTISTIGDFSDSAYMLRLFEAIHGEAM